MRVKRHHRVSILRWLMLVPLLLGIVVLPVLGSVGEIHELSHGLADHGSHAVDGDELSEAPAAEEGTAAKVLHLVHHLAHCCGQSAVAVPMLRLVLLSPQADLPQSALYERPVTAPLAVPFRPPIIG